VGCSHTTAFSFACPAITTRTKRMVRIVFFIVLLVE
jgi:hypothetical protein